MTDGVYVVCYERDEDGWWIVTIPGVQGCRTQGRSIAQGRRRVREALSLFIGDEAALRATLIDDVRLPAPARRAVREVEECRAEMERAQERARRAARLAVARLTRDAGLSVRDAAEVLGLSHQRVQQIAEGD
jgi:predicted RNase H-like HicB family nuclease